MKINVMERSGKPEVMTLRAKPMSIWLTRHVQLVIEKGDQLSSVAAEVIKHAKLKREHAQQLVAFWFACGERAENGNPNVGWSKSELHVSRGRRYLDRRPK
jgi:hypothetical protein